MKRYLSSFLFILTLAFGQTTVNPDISVIGDLLMDENGFQSSGIELAVQGYVNPFARADFYLHKHAGEEAIQIEEAVLSLERALPLNLGLRSGKFRPDLGRINKEHSHTYSFIFAPKAVSGIFGEEMWSSLGLEFNTLLPLSAYTKISMGYFDQGINPEHHHGDSDEEEDPHESGENRSAVSGRISCFTELGSYTNLESGLSYYRDLEGDIRHSIAVLDVKTKWRPDTYRSLILQGELFYRSALKDTLGYDEDPTSAGYLFLTYQFDKRWNAGAIIDYSSDLHENEYSGAGIFLGYSPVEETTVFRILVKNEKHGHETDITTTGQIIWALGPHKSHQF